MKVPIKHFVVITIFFFVIYPLGCKKDSTSNSNTNNNTPPNIQDSLVGTYRCTIHKVYYASRIGVSSTDTIIGSAIVSIIQGPIVNGVNYPVLLYQDSTQITFVTQNSDINSTAMLISFYYSNDSIILDMNGTLGDEAFREGGMTEYRGRKN